MSVATAIADLLAADAGLTALLSGGVWTRSLVRSATPEAFAESGQVKPAAVVKDRGENGDDTGPRAAYAGFPQIWLYAPATAAGRTALEAAVAAIVALLDGVTVEGVAGTGAGVRAIGRLGIDDDPVLAGALVDMLRLQVDGLWRAA